ncbi:MAG: class I SAM-dependent methyltransferase [Bacteroidia bacterium]
MHSPLKNPAWDPLGAAIRAYMDGQKDAWVLVRNSVQEDERLEASLFFRAPDQSMRVERELLERCKGKVLDIGAGAGVHALYLQEKGMDVTALDVSEEAVAVMRELGLEKAFCADVYEWDKGPYDTLLMLMNGIGIAGTLDGLSQFLNKAKSLLAPGGSILLESTDVMYAFTEEDGSFKVPGEHYYGQVTYQMSFDGKEGAPYPWLFVDPATLSMMAEAAGFRCNILYQSEDHNYAAELKA